MKNRPLNHGGALLLSMMVLVILSGIVAAGHILSSNQVLMTARSAEIDALQTTAEGLINYGYGVWKAEMMKRSTPMNSAEATALVTDAQGQKKRPQLPSWIQYESFTIWGLDDRGVPTDAPAKVASLSQQPKGWRSVSYNYAVQVTLVADTIGGKKRVSMEGVMRHDLIPPVGGLFYTEGDFELYKPAPMIVGGNVHTNARGFVTTHATDIDKKLRFLSSSNISFVDSYSHQAAPKSALWSSVGGASDVQPPIYDRGFANQVSKTERLEGIGTGTTAEFDTTDSNPNNDGNRELIEPPVAGYNDPDGIADSRIYNNAGIIIEISGPVTGTPSVTQPNPGVFTGNNVKITAKNGTALTTQKAQAIIGAISNDQTIVTETQVRVYNSKTKKYEWQTQTETSVVQKKVYDEREAKSVLVSDVNIGAINSTLNGIPDFNSILYINNTANTGGDPKAVRLKNAGVLPANGLTVATEGGLYVLGDYNTGTTTNPGVVPSNVSGNPAGTSEPKKSDYTTKPAALVADAVMFLSNSWSDSNATKSVSSRDASHTTINAAVIAGYIPSGWVNPNTGEEYWYSGGMNNFPRFLEDWTNKGMTFYGAFVQLYRSEMFTGEWNTGDIYVPPNRRWFFDTLLLERVIPGIPRASIFSKGRTRMLSEEELGFYSL
ncbi:MAG: hypothetical protein EOP84_01825 [Verrucomicrobiaceae bacterium]|nr:MAG: hypothetical protein EOP84_01825 [Verrucomicrobiaceae bacterium]